jgi:hypothetical protein
MFLSRVMEETLVDLFRKGSVKGTVVISIGNEATSVGMALPLRHGTDVVSFLQRDFGSHLVAGCSPLTLLCQYNANARSPTHGREGNVHHGDAAHLGAGVAAACVRPGPASVLGEEVAAAVVVGEDAIRVSRIDLEVNGFAGEDACWAPRREAAYACTSPHRPSTYNSP